MKSAHYENKGTYDGDWDDDKPKNDKVVEEVFAPQMRAAGMQVPGGFMDRLPMDFSAFTNWIAPNRRSVRTPDKLCKVPGYDRSVWFEAKDFPQINKHQSTGIKLRYLQVYIAVMHFYNDPVVLVFKDRLDQEAASGKGAPAMESAFNDPATGRENVYGMLLGDLIQCPESSYKYDEAPRDKQICFRAQMGPERASKRIMKTIPEIVADFREGRVRRVVIDPMSWGIFESIQNRAERYGLHKMSLPQGGLIVYTTNPKFPSVPEELL